MSEQREFGAAPADVGQLRVLGGGKDTEPALTPQSRRIARRAVTESTPADIVRWAIANRDGWLTLSSFTPRPVVGGVSTGEAALADVTG
jgi:hypothetical protein